MNFLIASILLLFPRAEPLQALDMSMSVGFIGHDPRTKALGQDIFIGVNLELSYAQKFESTWIEFGLSALGGSGLGHCCPKQFEVALATWESGSESRIFAQKSGFLKTSPPLLCFSPHAHPVTMFCCPNRGPKPGQSPGGAGGMKGLSSHSFRSR